MPLGAFKAALMGTAGVSTGDVVLLSTVTASSDATVSFTSELTSTYGEYIFGFYNLNPETDGQNITFQGSIDGGSNYNVAITSTYFTATNNEADDQAILVYDGNGDQAQGTSFQPLGIGQGSGGDESWAGKLHLFNPSSTTYVKHFYSRGHRCDDYSQDQFVAGYLNTTDNIDAVQFKFASGDFDGKIKMWGVK